MYTYYLLISTYYLLISTYYLLIILFNPIRGMQKIMVNRMTGVYLHMIYVYIHMYVYIFKSISIVSIYIYINVYCMYTYILLGIQKVMVNRMTGWYLHVYISKFMFA
jgi:hypothetical protein